MFKTAGYGAVVVEGCSFRWRCVEGLLVACRKTLRGEDERGLKTMLRGIKLRYPLVAVEPLSRQAARFAARDRRVDLIVLSRDTLQYIDKTQARMMKHHGKILEIRMSDYFRMDQREKAMVYRRINLFRSIDADVVFSSGARSIYEVIPVFSLTRLAANLYGIRIGYVEASVSTLIWKRLVDGGVKRCRSG